MTFVFKIFPASEIAAAYTEAPGGGDKRDINSLRNRPAKDPDNWLANLKLHSSLDYLERESVNVVPINHSLVAGTTTGGSGAGSDADGLTGGGQNAANLKYGQSSATYLLKTHGLGYRPIVVVLVNGKRLFNGQPVQTNSDGRARYISIYVTTTEVRLHEWTSVSGSSLAAVSIDYTVLVIRNPRTASGDKLFEHDAGVTTLGRGRFSNKRRYLQVTPGGSPWTMSSGRQGDFSLHGAPRFNYPDGTVYDPVPNTMKGKFVVQYKNGAGTNTYDPGYDTPNMSYQGSFAGSPAISIQTDPPNDGDAREGFFFEPDEERIRFVDDGVTTSTSEGTLLMFLNTVHTFATQNLVFPDISKDIDYIWKGNNVLKATDFTRMLRAESCAVQITAIPGSQVSEIELMTVPSGADFFVGHMQLTRAIAPANTWQARTLGMLPVANQYIPLFGAETILLEAEIGFARGLHVYINSNNKLTLRLEQSTGIAINGYGNIKSMVGPGTQGGGANIQFNTTKGIPIALRSNKSRGYTETAAGGFNFEDYVKGGSSPCASNDNTTYTATYQVVDLSVRFGKRS